MEAVEGVHERNDVMVRKKGQMSHFVTQNRKYEARKHGQHIMGKAGILVAT